MSTSSSTAKARPETHAARREARRPVGQACGRGRGGPDNSRREGLSALLSRQAAKEKIWRRNALCAGVCGDTIPAARSRHARVTVHGPNFRAGPSSSPLIFMFMFPWKFTSAQRRGASPPRVSRATSGSQARCGQGRCGQCYRKLCG